MKNAAFLAIQILAALFALWQVAALLIGFATPASSPTLFASNYLIEFVFNYGVVILLFTMAFPLAIFIPILFIFASIGLVISIALRRKSAAYLSVAVALSWLLIWQISLISTNFQANGLTPESVRLNLVGTVGLFVWIAACGFLIKMARKRDLN